MREKIKKSTGKTKADAIVKAKDEFLSIPKCQFTELGLLIDDSVTEEEFIRLGEFLQHINKGIMFNLGDWCVFGEFKDEFAMTPALGAVRESYEDSTIKNAMWVCHKIPLSRRREELSFGHHQVVAPLPPEEQDYWLERAVKERLSVMKLRELVRKGRKQKKVKKYAEKFPKEAAEQLCLDVIMKWSYEIASIIMDMEEKIGKLIRAKRDCYPDLFNSKRDNIPEEERCLINAGKYFIKQFEILLGDGMPEEMPQDEDYSDDALDIFIDSLKEK
jgi:hypothetical protein